MNRKAETFFDAITLLREDLVEEAQNYVFRKKRTGWRKFGSLAACLLLVASLGMLAALPKGCGAAPGIDHNSNTSSGAPMNPDAAPRDPSRTPAGDGSIEMGGAPPDYGVSTEVPPAAAEQIRFTAQILEVLEDCLLAEPLADEELPVEADQIRIPLDGLEDLTDLRPGDIVTVNCQSFSLEDGGTVAAGVAAVQLIGPDRP